MAEKLPIAEVSNAFREEGSKLLKQAEEQGNIEGLAVMDEPREHTAWVIVPPATYELTRHVAEMFENPDAHDFKIRRYWDTGLKMTMGQAFGREPVSGFFRFREKLYEKRVQLYRALHIRPRLRPSAPAPA